MVRRAAKPRPKRSGCTAPRCTIEPTVWNRSAWWCPVHDPGDAGDPNCTHSLHSRSPVWGDRDLCSFCGGLVTDVTDEQVDNPTTVG